MTKNNSIQLETLLEFSKLLNTSLTLNEMLKHLLRIVFGHLLVTEGLIAIKNEDNYKIALVYGLKGLNEGELFDRVSFHHTSIYRIYPIGNASIPMGYLAIGYPTKGEITAKEEETLQILLDVAFNSINNATSYQQVKILNQELSQKNQDLSTILEFSRQISSTIEPKNVMLLLGLTLSGHWAVKRYAFVAWKKPHLPILRQKGVILPELELLKKALVNFPDIVLVTDLTESNVKEKLLAQKVEVIFPIYESVSEANNNSETELIGLIALGQSAKGYYTELELAFGASLVAQSAVALQNAWHIHETIEKNQTEAKLAVQKHTNLVFSTFSEALAGFLLDGKYRLENKIGSGGVGAVYKALHIGLNNYVAIKILHPMPENKNKDHLERFRREGISACRINHPNAVSVLDAGVSAEGITYLVMELLNGSSLTEELKKQKSFSAIECAEILLPVCSVLDKAHSLGMVHRDIKTENIFLHQTSDGQVVKVIDFGLAKIYANNTDSDLITLSKPEEILGTPPYMSPEQWENAFNVDARSDIYSLGITAYELLTGDVPFKEQGYALMYAHLAKPIPPLPTIFPTKLHSIIVKATAKDPKDRYQRALEFAQALREVVGLDEKYNLPKLDNLLFSEFLNTGTEQSEKPLLEPELNNHSKQDINSLYETEIETESFINRLRIRLSLILNGVKSKQ